MFVAISATGRRLDAFIPRVMDPETPLNGAIQFPGQLSPALMAYWLLGPSARTVK